ncbi:GIY-YIG nuclease family protein [Lactococcus garvieae]|uniref:GIY-YIG nuclease family protein n=1 Tax=Lactococcus garvieae TaxID=1363 RepID=A0AA46YQH4_9LACT|nr:GIY-YIG nuclease family protein [Lactococcus garvieae]UYT09870.1 GIY-YIG nuclease family protein [Lactococcus garvieae]UYT11843.1 GIY-YIG nuclease family protein [Lactococcus garvieae]
MKSYFVYVLRCADDTLYCGYTDDVTKRLETHNSAKGAKYTKARRPLQLLTSVEFSDKKRALKCEWWFKHKLNRSQKLKLIKEKTIKETFEQELLAKEKG